jgi:hypothetical protein
LLDTEGKQKRSKPDLLFVKFSTSDKKHSFKKLGVNFSKFFTWVY